MPLGTGRAFVVAGSLPRVAEGLQQLHERRQLELLERLVVGLLVALGHAQRGAQPAREGIVTLHEVGEVPDPDDPVEVAGDLVEQLGLCRPQLVDLQQSRIQVEARLDPLALVLGERLGVDERVRIQQRVLQRLPRGIPEELLLAVFPRVADQDAERGAAWVGVARGRQRGEQRLMAREPAAAGALGLLRLAAQD